MESNDKLEEIGIKNRTCYQKKLVLKIVCAIILMI